nr:FAD-binding protein [Lactobacillus delbrueckii]
MNISHQVIHDHPCPGHRISIVIKKAEENGYEDIITADSVGELAEKLDIPADKLQKTIDDYNSYCDHGQDREFFKNPDYLHKLTGKGGYLVGKFYSGAYGTVGGVKIDEYCQVLDDEDLKTWLFQASTARDQMLTPSTPIATTLPCQATLWALLQTQAALPAWKQPNSLRSNCIELKGG